MHNPFEQLINYKSREGPPKFVRKPRSNPLDISRSISKRNKSGIKGVYYNSTKKAYHVSWGGKCYTSNKDFFEACCIRKSLEAEFLRNNNG